jgi:hypothetical protein
MELVTSTSDCFGWDDQRLAESLARTVATWIHGAEDECLAESLAHPLAPGLPTRSMVPFRGILANCEVPVEQASAVVVCEAPQALKAVRVRNRTAEQRREEVLRRRQRDRDAVKDIEIDWEAIVKQRETDMNANAELQKTVHMLEQQLGCRKREIDKLRADLEKEEQGKKLAERKARRYQAELLLAIGDLGEPV